MKIKKTLPHELFAVPIQAAVDGRVVARETKSAARKHVTDKLYGGDRSRKIKLLKKQKKGKKKLAKFGKVGLLPRS
jgi:GTP-binding protein LepA